MSDAHDAQAANRATYLQWVKDCAVSDKPGETREELLQHIQKHAGPDLMKRVIQDKNLDTAEWIAWIASMYNILAIFELRMLGRQVNYDEKLARMYRSWEKNQQHYQGPPTDHA